MDRVIAAAVQATPVWCDRDASVEKACSLIAEAAGNGAALIALPEAFIPTYPDWVWRSAPWSEGAAERFGKLLDNSVLVPSAATERLGDAARSAGAYVCIGVNEREAQGSTLYNTLLYFGPDGRLLSKHRKLMPTGGERVVWGMGDGSGLRVIETPFGRVGGLICWEQYMPLARYAMYGQGIDVLIAPTWDNSDAWLCTVRHNAREGRVWVVAVAPVLRGSDVPDDFPGRKRLYGGPEDWMCRGFSAISDPDGNLVEGPLVEEEGILYAELDIDRARASRLEFDPVGHYSRPDIFQLTVNTGARVPVTYEAPPPTRKEDAPVTDSDESSPDGAGGLSQDQSSSHSGPASQGSSSTV
jgi:nitrilase